MAKAKVDEGLLQPKPAGNGAAAEAVVKPKKKAKARRRRKKAAAPEAPAKYNKERMAHPLGWPSASLRCARLPARR